MTSMIDHTQLWKAKIFCKGNASQNIAKNMAQPVKMGETICQQHICKELIFKIYKTLLHLNSSKTVWFKNGPNMDEELNRHFCKVYITCGISKNLPGSID